MRLPDPEPYLFKYHFPETIHTYFSEQGSTPLLQSTDAVGSTWIPRPSPIVELVGSGVGGGSKLNEKRARWDTRAQSKGKEGQTKREEAHSLTTARRGGVFWAVDQRELGWEASLEGTVWPEARRKLASMPGLR